MKDGYAKKKKEKELAAAEAKDKPSVEETKESEKSETTIDTTT